MHLCINDFHVQCKANVVVKSVPRLVTVQKAITRSQIKQHSTKIYFFTTATPIKVQVKATEFWLASCVVFLKYELFNLIFLEAVSLLTSVVSCREEITSEGQKVIWYQYC